MVTRKNEMLSDGEKSHLGNLHTLRYHIIRGPFKHTLSFHRKRAEVSLNPHIMVLLAATGGNDAKSTILQEHQMVGASIRKH